MANMSDDRPPQPLKRPPSPIQQSKPEDLTKSQSGIEILLSKSVYSLNSPIVGSIRIPLNDNNNYKSVQIYAAGRCRLDPRWHDVPSLTRIYGTHPHHGNLPNGVEETAVDCYFGKKTAVVDKKGLGSVPCVCFWSTDALTLYDRRCGQKDGDGDGDGDDGAIQVPVVKGYVPGETEPLCMEGGEWLEQGKKLTHSTSTGDDNNVDGNVPQVGSDVVGDNDDDSDEQRDQRIRSHILNNDYEYSDDCSSTGEGKNFDHGNGAIPAVPIQTPIDNSCESELDNDQQQVEQYPTKTLYFTFRADLPNDLPPSANATCARYFYSVVLVAQTMDGKVCLLIYTCLLHFWHSN